MKNDFKYDSQEARERYNLLTDDMLYNIIVNLRDNGLSFDDLADGLGIQTNELLDKLVDRDKDFFVCLESISYLQDKEVFTDHSRINSKPRSK